MKLTPYLIVIVFASTFLGCVAPPSTNLGTVQDKKLVKLYGLDKPSTSFLKENIAEIEKTPLDGICIIVQTDQPKPGDTMRKDGNYLWFTVAQLKREDFTQAVADLNATNFKRLNYNFLHYAARGRGNADWFNDAQWNQVTENAKVAGWVINQTPLVGMTFDSEYGGGGVWNYAKLTAEGGPDFEAYSAKVRQRGRAWAAAISAAAPEVILCLSHGYWQASPETDWWGSQDGASKTKALSEQLYALYPAFLDGVLEGLGPHATLVDGCEQTYPYMVYDTFMNFRRWAHTQSMKLTTVPELYESRMTYAMATWPGFRSDVPGMWQPGNPGQNFFTPDNLAHGLHNAMAASDQFAWIWSGVDLWWPMSVPPRKYGDDIGWGTLKPYPDVYRKAMADSKTPMDLSWRPVNRDEGDYPAPKANAFPDDQFEVLMDLPQKWWFMPEPDNVLFSRAQVYSGWTNNARPNLDESANGWKQLRIDDTWERQGEAYDGVAWYRTHIKAPPTVQGRRLWLAFGGVGQDAHVFVAPQGMPTRQLGSGGGGKPFVIDATGAFMPGKETLVAVRVINHSGPGGIFDYVKLVGQKGEQPYIAKPGDYPVLDLDFNKINGDRVLDESGFDNHAILRGCKVVALPNGKRAVQLNGSSSSVHIAAQPSLNAWNARRTWEILYSPGMDIPVSGIVYHALLAKHSSYGEGIYLAQNSKPARIVFLQAGPKQSLEYPVKDSKGWYHIVGTYDGLEMKLYINGKLVGSRNTPIPPTVNSSPVSIGGGATDANRCSPGIVSRAAIYNYALDAQQVQARYSAVTAEDGR